jgi:hypothetical protein
MASHADPCHRVSQQFFWSRKIVRKEITHELLQNLPTPPEGKRKLR